MEFRVGQQLGNYRLLCLLGQGGFSDVYLGEHLHLKTLAAIKVLQMRLLASMMEQFQTEAQAIASLVHPHIVRTLDFGLTDGVPFLIMDYAPNGTLRDRCPKGTRLSLDTIVAYVRQVADALHYAHERKLIHRDIKPENMLLGQPDTLLLSDFGLVLLAQSSESRSTKEIAGTVPYMAPEQIQGKPRPASDQYALGIVVYEWLSGSRPFEGSVFEIYGQHLHVAPPSFHEKGVAISSEVEQVVLKALAKDPKERFADVAAFATALEHASHLAQSSAFGNLATGDALLNQSAFSTFIKTQPLQAVPARGVNIPHGAIETSEDATYLKTPLSQTSFPTVTTTPVPGTSSPTAINLLSDESSQSTHVIPPLGQVPSAVINTPSDRSVSFAQPDRSTYIVPLPSQSLPAPSQDSPLYQSIQSVQPSPPLVAAGSPPLKRRRRWLVAILTLFVLLLISGSVADAVFGGWPFSIKNGIFGSRGTVTTTNGAGGSVGTATTTNGVGGSGNAVSSATITITPASRDVKHSYTILAVTGTPNSSQHQVKARFLSVPTQPHAQIVNTTGTGTTPGTQATGILTFTDIFGNGLILPAGSVYTDASGIQVVTDAAVNIQPSGGGGTENVPAHVNKIGVSGNIPANDIDQNDPTYTYRIQNTNAFSGGKDPQTYPVVQQSDINGAANTLEATYNPNAQQVLQGQIQANEQPIGSQRCTPTVHSDHSAGDQAANVTVTVSFTCTGEVYDQQGALTMAEQWLKQDAAQNPGTGYALVGNIVTTQGQAQLSDSQGTVSIPVTEEGVWVYQFGAAQEHAIAMQIAGKKKSEAQTLLLHQSNMTQATIQLFGSGDTLPVDFQQIRFVIVSVHGK